MFQDGKTGQAYFSISIFKKRYFVTKIVLTYLTHLGTFLLYILFMLSKLGVDKEQPILYLKATSIFQIWCAKW